jgi:hypothetical protein
LPIFGPMQSGEAADMLSITVYRDTWLKPKAFPHKRGTSVHIEFESMGYIAITPDKADELAEDLRIAADAARAADREMTESADRD